jgi:hypothetical protein
MARNYAAPPALTPEATLPHRNVDLDDDEGDLCCPENKPEAVKNPATGLSARLALARETVKRKQCLPNIKGTQRNAAGVADMHGLDETFKLADDDYYLQQVKVRNFKTRTSVKYKNRVFKNKDKTGDKNVCGICKQRYPAQSTSTVDWIGCDNCGQWFHYICCGYTSGQGDFFCIQCKHLSNVDMESDQST